MVVLGLGLGFRVYGGLGFMGLQGSGVYPKLDHC